MSFVETSPTVATVATVATAPAPAPAPTTSTPTAARVKPLPYSDAQSLAFWTAKTTEDKAGALWLAIAPLMSRYIVDGGTAASLRGDVKGMTQLAAAIHSGKGKRDRAARAVFAQCLKDYKARECAASETGHADALETLEAVFYGALSGTSVARKAQAPRYTLAQVSEMLTAGTIDAETTRAIARALPAWARAELVKALVKAPASEAPAPF